METKELRLNNLFIDNKTNTVISVIGLTEEIITFSGHFKNDWQAEPIPLTEEWLLKFGFYVIEVAGMDNEYSTETEEAEISWDKTNGIIIFILENVESFRVSHIKNVHQLQNLYFALTNKELTIK
jgi:hypothetical protein